MARNVALIVGSLRKDSITRKVSTALIELAPDSLQIEHVEIGTLPLYNQDLETDTPPREWVEYRDRLRRMDAVLFATPEYNRSVPGGMKNAIDVGSRPYGHSVFNGKPCAVVSASPGQLGGFGANHHLRQSCVFLDMPVMQQPEMYLSHADKLLDDQGKLVEKSRDFARKFMEAFAAWIDRFAGADKKRSAA
ncbi:MAG TPA: NAD(P)H-dependent oxidoreductase [Kofleriaceae bacterium]